MNLQSIVILIIVFVLLALAILFICQNGGWQGGCAGNCASCHNRCATPKPEGEKAATDKKQDTDPTAQ